MQQTEAKYGTMPVDLGFIGLEPKEMMFWMYCPVKLPGRVAIVLPDNLNQFSPLMRRVFNDCADRWHESYVYLTAKTLWVTPDSPGNRPGWHSDGFLTDDLNYIWSDRAPTVFFHDGGLHAFSADHEASLPEMEALCRTDAFVLYAYPDKHLLRLDETVLHRTPEAFAPGMRTFVKISVSRHRYALEGNSINHLLAPDWDYQPRKAERNCPIGEAA